MKLRPFGNTGMNVSEIGLGAWQLANPDWGVNDKDEALKIVQKSLEAGCNFFDTAPGYGGGRSEKLLGQGLKSVRKDVIICTKFSHYKGGKRDFDVKHVRPVLEGSFKRLQTDYVDILLLHNPPREQMDGNVSAELYAELEKLKTEGKIREYGVSLDWRIELENVLDTTKSKAAEVFFNALYQEMMPAFSKAQEQGMGLIVKVPLDSGWLSGRYRGNHKFDDVRNRWSPEVLARRNDLIEKFAALVPQGTSMAHAALQFVLAQPEVSTVIPGAKTVDQALNNFAAADKQLSPEVVQSMYDLWKREIESDPLPW
ncbi:MAG: aldo/keto reductase [Anaerolineae bacterium]|nr:aldo/keto reductase [Anaerolineae bacterium]MCI0609922.1 aldo/keto reductase [Anaerolineae bacterium]